jgi:hypothetical protein
MPSRLVPGKGGEVRPCCASQPLASAKDAFAHSRSEHPPAAWSNLVFAQRPGVTGLDKRDLRGFDSLTFHGVAV